MLLNVNLKTNYVLIRTYPFHSGGLLATVCFSPYNTMGERQAGISSDKQKNR